ncbi:MAG: hypothetical protein HKN14_08185 [Marinicaulis sp.]|nr:hypothetical protein [Marinicaulis sp.]NNL89255.1 hypothetical protein [Marinicaulis sp.]
MRRALAIFFGARDETQQWRDEPCLEVIRTLVSGLCLYDIAQHELGAGDGFQRTGC